MIRENPNQFCYYETGCLILFISKLCVLNLNHPGATDYGLLEEFYQRQKNKKTKTKQNKAIAMMRRKSPRSENIYLIKTHCQANISK